MGEFQFQNSISSDIEGQDSLHGRKFFQLPQAGKCLTWCLHGFDTKVSDKTERHRKAGTNSGGHDAICQSVILLNYCLPDTLECGNHM